jgi:hypothetical protein
MPFALEQLSQGLTVLGQLPSQSLGTGTDNSITNIDMSKIQRLLFVLNIGSVGAGPGTVDFKLQQSATSGGTYSDLTGTAITTISANNKVATVEIRADQLAAGNRYVRHNLAIGTNAVIIGVIALGGEAEYKPASKQDSAVVAQRLVL